MRCSGERPQTPSIFLLAVTADVGEIRRRKCIGGFEPLLLFSKDSP